MRAAEVLGELRRLGITLTASDGKLTARPKTALTDESRRLIRSYKPALIEVLTERAAEVAIPAFYERVLGNTPRAFATLEPEEIAEASRIGLLPAGIAEGVVVLAYRTGGAQGLMTIPAERYDGLRVLELFRGAG